MNNSENSISETKAERKQVAATLEVAQPKPNTSAVSTAAGAIAQSIPNRH